MEVTNEAIKNAVKELFGNHEIKETSTGISVVIERKDEHSIYFDSITIWQMFTYDGKPEKFKIFGMNSEYSRYSDYKRNRNFTAQISGDVKKTIARLESLAKTYA